MSKTVLITGIAGFLGSHVAEECVRRGYRVIGIDDLSGGYDKNVPDGVHSWYRRSILDTGLVDGLFEQYKPDYVFHLAAYAAEGLSHFIRGYNARVNYEGSMHVLNACIKHNVRRLIFTSSIAVYGYGNHQRCTGSLETDRPEPIDPYGISKLAVEMELQSAKRMFDLDYTIFRPHNVFGERQNLSDGYRNVVGIFMRQRLQGKPMTIFGDGHQRRQFTHVSNIAATMVDAIEIKGESGDIFNIGGDDYWSVNNLAELVAKALGVSDERVYLPERHEVFMATCDHRKASATFPDHPGIAFKDGLARMAAWAKTQTLREPKRFEGIEIEKNLPEVWR